MTFGKLLLMMVIGIGYAIAVEAGLVILIVPGFFLGVRWYFASFFTALGESGNPFGLSWKLTQGSYWRTFGILFCVSVIVVVGLGVCYAIAGGLAYAFAPSVILFGPLLVATYIVALNFQALALVRWMMVLRAETVTVPSAGTYGQTLTRTEYS